MKFLLIEQHINELQLSSTDQTLFFCSAPYVAEMEIG